MDLNSKIERIGGRRPVVHFAPVGDGAWPDLAEKERIYTTCEIHVSSLPEGMASGKTSVTLRIDLPGNQAVLAETSLDALAAVVATLQGRQGPNGGSPTGGSPTGEVRR